MLKVPVQYFPPAATSQASLGQWFGPPANIAAPASNTPAGKSGEYCVRYLQTLLQRRGVLGFDAVTGTWNMPTMQYLEWTFPSWRTFPGGACTIAATILATPAGTTKGGIFPGGYNPGGASTLPFGLSPLTLGIIGAALAAGVVIIVAGRK